MPPVLVGVPPSVGFGDRLKPGLQPQDPSVSAGIAALQDVHRGSHETRAQFLEPGTNPLVPPGLDRILLETVADKTGYPAEMLDLDMRLDADLGIDSIKRVEILSALQDRFPGLPPAGPEKIGSLETLRDIVAFLGEARVPELATSGSSPPRTEPRPPGGSDPAPLSEETVTRALLEVVSEKTGYPVDMLELEMRLDADLGIDSIKRVEIFSGVQERLPETIAIGPEQTGTLQTLGQIVAFLSSPPCPEPDPARTDSRRGENGRASGVASQNGKATDTEGHEGTAQPSRNGHGHSSNGQAVRLRRLEPRAVPMAAPERREAVRLPSGGTIGITDDGSALTEAVRALLVNRGYRARVIPAGAVDPPVLDQGLSGLIVLAPMGQCDATFIARAFRTIRAAGPGLVRSGQLGGASLVTVSRMDGRFGLGGLAPEIDPTSGSLAGLAKTAGQEWAGLHCKALDLDAAFASSAQAAAGIVDELLTIGPAEVGLSARGRVVIELGAVGEPNAAVRRTPRIGRGDLVVITGGARGITAEVAVALAEAFQPRLLLLGRSPEPGAAEDQPLADCHDEVALKRALLSRPDRFRSPQAIGEQVRQIMARREVRPETSIALPRSARRSSIVPSM